MRKGENTLHDIKMDLKKQRNATMTVGYVERGPMPSPEQFMKLPKTSCVWGQGKRKTEIKPTKNNDPAYRKGNRA